MVNLSADQGCRCHPGLFRTHDIHIIELAKAWSQNFSAMYFSLSACQRHQPCNRLVKFMASPMQPNLLPGKLREQGSVPAICPLPIPTRRQSNAATRPKNFTRKWNPTSTCSLVKQPRYFVQVWSVCVAACLGHVSLLRNLFCNLCCAACPFCDAFPASFAVTRRFIFIVLPMHPTKTFPVWMPTPRRRKASER